MFVCIGKLVYELMYYTMHHGIVISKFAEINLNYGVGAQFISAGDRSDRLIYVDVVIPKV